MARLQAKRHLSLVFRETFRKIAHSTFMLRICSLVAILSLLSASENVYAECPYEHRMPVYKDQRHIKTSSILKIYEYDGKLVLSAYNDVNLCEIEDGKLNVVKSIKIYQDCNKGTTIVNDTLYVANKVCGLELYDVKSGNFIGNYIDVIEQSSMIHNRIDVVGDIVITSGMESHISSCINLFKVSDNGHKIDIIGYLGVGGTVEYVIVDNMLYLATTNDDTVSLWVYEISSEGEMTLTDERVILEDEQSSRDRRPYKMKRKGDYVYIVFKNEVGVLDVSDVHKPVFVGTVDVPCEWGELFVDDDMLYLMRDDRLVRMSLSDPERPEIVREDIDEKFINITKYYIYNDYLVAIYETGSYEDIDNIMLMPLDQKEVEFNFYDNKDKKITIANNKNYLYMSNNYYRRLDVYDIRKPGVPKLVNMVDDIPNNVYAMVIKDDVMIIHRDSDDHFYVYDVTDPKAPKYAQSVCPEEGYELHECIKSTIAIASSGIATMKGRKGEIWNRETKRYFLSIKSPYDIRKESEMTREHYSEGTYYSEMVLSDDGRLGCTFVRAFPQPSEYSYVSFYDLSDIEKPKLINNITFPPEEYRTRTGNTIIDVVYKDSTWFIYSKSNEGCISEVKNIEGTYRIVKTVEAIRDSQSGNRVSHMLMKGNNIVLMGRIISIYTIDDEGNYDNTLLMRAYRNYTKNEVVLDDNGYLHVADRAEYMIFDVRDAVDHCDGYLQDPVPTSPMIRYAAPNPFNISVSIHFVLTEAADARLTVYDVLGRKVGDLLKAELLPRGEHVCTWQPDHLSSGVYFARLESAGKVSTVKTVLLK